MKKGKSISFESMHRKSMNDPEFRDLFKKAQNKGRIQQALFDLRKESGVTQEKLAELVGTRQSNISRWEQGLCDGMKLATLERLAAALNCNLDVKFVPKKGRG